MKLKCPRVTCPHHQPTPDFGPRSRLFSKRGTFFRKHDSRRIQRYQCKSCRRTFCSATLHPAYLQKKRRLNPKIRALLANSVSQRSTARILGVSRGTVASKLKYLASLEKLSNDEFLKRIQSDASIESVQFDEMETHHHTLYKPLSIALAVDAKTYKIIDFQVSQMPVARVFAKKAREKYGYREDKRDEGMHRMFRNLKKRLPKNVKLISDQNPRYPKFVREYFPDSEYKRTKGRRGTVVGQGELKEGGRDPLFPLNQTCAKIRDRMSRLKRKTWCTTKKVESLEDHLRLYAAYHNEEKDRAQRSKYPA